jgi:hypothetical protein
MAGRKLPQLPSLAEKPADDDIIYLVDVSDTSESPEGTSKQIEYADLGVPTTDTTFAPTITDEVNGTFTIDNFKIKRVGDICTFSFAGRFDLEGGETSGAAKFDLPTLFQPSANWASQTDVNVIISQTNGIITAESKLNSDDSGTKLIAAQLASTTAGASIRFSAIGEYVIS